MIAAVKGNYLVPLVVFIFVIVTWDVFGEPKGGQKRTAESSGAVSNDSYMGLSGEELWSNNCLRCHNIRPPTMYSNAQQRAIVEFLKSAK